MDFTKFKYAKVDGEDYVLERRFRSKTQAKDYAGRLRKRTSSSVRVLKRLGYWGVYSGQQEENNAKTESQKETRQNQEEKSDPVQAG